MKTLFNPGRLDDGPPEAAQHPTFREAFLFWPASLTKSSEICERCGL
jgi:hypothetical protein